ncbi:hypothetical protein BG842_26330 [Haladaptatus sp. W1]|uniref:hypothetical protein n=1 Tax=Haladaptatus sp. W1 TaxID=1897478 RepID=UPI000849DFD1|nr:hypothetical protein BG842_26330 [Haladaptatus sp. W1]
MPMYNRDDADGIRVVDRWDDGIGWLAHPEEDGRRASHAIRGPDGDVWLFDPLDAPGVDELVAELGEVAGVAVFSNWHARNAGSFARRHDVPVHLPRWMDRIAERVDAPVQRYGHEVGTSGFHVRRCSPLPGWDEAIAYRKSDDTLYVADVLGTAPLFTVGEERLGVYLLRRPFPPRSHFADVQPERIIVGHGEGVFESATEALSDALDNARWRFPTAVAESGGAQLRALFGALRD